MGKYITEALEALGDSSRVLLTPTRSKRDTFSGEEKRIAGVSFIFNCNELEGCW